jgi:hypothetical protein
MKTVRNKTHRPLRVRLSRGKTLHLGPLKEGQINTHDVEAGGVKSLVESGELEILGDGPQGAAAAAPAAAGHANTQGHHPGVAVPKRGDR